MFIASLAICAHPDLRRFLPYVGMVTIILNDYPQLKVALLVVLGVFVLFSKEE